MSSSSSYALAKASKLKLKCDASERKRKKKAKKEKKAKRRRDADSAKVAKSQPDTDSHGGWWSVSETDQISGNLAIELDAHAYLSALDNGRFVQGPTHVPGEPPEPQEVFVAVPLPDGKLGLRSGYGKFLGLDGSSRLIGVADAIGQREMWQPVFEEGRTALLGPNACFLTRREGESEGDYEVQLVCDSQRVDSERQLLTLRCNRALDTDPKLLLAEEEREGAVKAEANYARKFQSWQDGKLRLSTDSKGQLHRARRDGTLHEALLDRREKQKSDKFCK